MHKNLVMRKSKDTVSIAYAKENFYKLANDVNACFKTIINIKGKNAALISKQSWKNIKETLYLSSIPRFVDNINNIRKNENWNKATCFDPNEEK